VRRRGLDREAKARGAEQSRIEMLKKFKQATLTSMKTVGVFGIADRSRWRRSRLLILAYHGISLADEHEWDSSLFMSPGDFAARLKLIRRAGCAVLPLGEAVERLYANDLPDKSVVLTFDDGTYDFRERAHPLVAEFGFPVTLYLTTFYSEFARPVFNVVVSYLLWKGRASRLDLSALVGRDATLDLSTTQARNEAAREIREFAEREKMSAEERDALAASLAQQLKIDYDALVASRLLQILAPGEVKELARAGVDVQLHTHRHRAPLERGLFLREIEENRSRIRALTGACAQHFCYPSGVYDARHLPWLEEAGVRSATTCDVGLASRESNRLLLPRLIDSSTLSTVEFEGWLTGLSSALPRRRLAPHVAG
jgi:peptidoglycan/xylan/chitin deacetylase (PgdA/CDA1 family)